MSVMTEEEMDYQIELQKLYSNESDSAENLYEFSESELSAHDTQTRADERAKVLDEIDAIIDFIKDNSFDHSLGLDSFKAIGSSVVLYLLENLKE